MIEKLKEAQAQFEDAFADLREAIRIDARDQVARWLEWLAKNGEGWEELGFPEVVTSLAGLVRDARGEDLEPAVIEELKRSAMKMERPLGGESSLQIWEQDVDGSVTWIKP